MKKRMKRLAAMLLLGCMVAGSVPGGLVYAEESDPVSDLTEDTETGDVQEAEDEQIPENDVKEAEDEQASENDVEEAEDDQTSGNNVHEAEDNQTSENDVQEAENDQISESDVQETDDAEKLQESDGKETDDQNEEAIKEQTSENSIIEKNADAINYVIVESPYLETPGTERIAVSYGDGSENISDATLTVRDDEGQETIWDLSVSADQLYLFTYEYTDESETGTYEVISLNVTDDTGEKAVLLSESGMEANFGVNEEYSGIEELQPLDVEMAKSRTADEAADVEATVAEIDPDNVEESTEQIVNALENAEEQTGGAADSSAGISAFAATMGAKAKAAAAKSDDGNIVVALDPGHDSTHAGASSNGLREEVLTLKIANYCKEELEKYAGVTVYMTRTGAACPHPGGSSGSDIGDRVYAAADAGADIYVSLHLNSSTASSVNGSEVIIPNKSWKPQVAEEGEKLAEAILKELKAIGLNMRPDEIYSKDTTINERYPDGSISDYFSVQIYAKERGIPGIIVEHAFITNSGDRNYLNSGSGLKKLGVADATGIAKYLGLAKLGEKVAVPEGTYVLESALGGGKNLTISGNDTGNYTPVILNDNNGLSSQRFEVTSAGNGYYYIVAEHSGKAVDVKGGSSESGTMLQQYSLNKSANAQKWSFINAGDGYYYLRSALGTYMDVKSGSSANGTTIQARDLNQSKAQKWKLIESDYRPISDGTYSIHNAVDTNKFLDVASGSTQDKANIKLFTFNDGSAQRYEITYVGDGYYRISPEHSGKSLDVTGGKSDNGTILQQYTWTGVKAQLWKFIDQGDGLYSIRSKCGTVIDISDKTAATNAGVYMWEYTGAISQKWHLTMSDYRPVEDGEYVISNIKSDSQVMTEKKGNIQIEAYNNLQEQCFKVTYDKDGYYDIVLMSDGRALDVYDASDKPKTNLQVHTANGTKAQKWKFVSAGNGSYYIKSKVGTVIDLTSGNTTSGTNIQMYTMSYVDAQKWNLDASRTSIEPVAVEEGTYTIQNVSNTSQVMDLYDGSEKNSANIQTHVSNGTPAQRFEIQKVTDEYYRILIERSGKALDVHGASSEAGTNVQQYVSNDSAAQLWRFLDAGNGEYYIQSKLGTVIDLNKKVASNGTNVEMNNLTGSSSQKWKLIPTDYRPVSDGVYSFRVTSSKNQVLSVENSSVDDKGNVEINTYDAKQSQHFEVKYVKDGYYSIVGKESGKALEYDVSVSDKEKNVRQNEWTGAKQQLWKFVHISGDGYYIKAYNGQFLDVKSGKIVAGSNVQVFDINGGNAQKWTIRNEIELKTVDVPEGIYTIQTALNKNRLLDIAGGVTTNGGNVQIFNDNGSLAQKFKIEKVAGEYYRIISQKSQKALDIYNASMISGTNVQQYSSNNSNAQLWRFLDAGNGEYYIQSKLGTVLDVYDGSTDIRTNVWAYKLNQSDAQKWILDDNREELYEIMGSSSVSISQMVNMYKKYNTSYPYEDTDVPTIEDFCLLFEEECEAEGVKTEVAFCQAMLETGFLKFGGDVKKEQYNFAGLGATGSGEKGLSFPDIRTGIRAQVQHLKAYASSDDLKNKCVDPRFNYVTRESAKYVQWLGILENPTNTGWAASANYGYILLESYILPLKKL